MQWTVFSLSVNRIRVNGKLKTKRWAHFLPLNWESFSIFRIVHIEFKTEASPTIAFVSFAFFVLLSIHSYLAIRKFVSWIRIFNFCITFFYSFFFSFHFLSLCSFEVDFWANNSINNNKIERASEEPYNVAWNERKRKRKGAGYCRHWLLKP